MPLRVVKGGIDHVSRRINSAFHVSIENKNVSIRSVFLTLAKNYSQRTALFDVLTILPFLVLGAAKRKPSSVFTS